MDLLRLQLEPVAKFQSNGAWLHNKLPVAVAEPTLGYASVIAPVADRESTGWCRFIAEILDVQHSAPGIRHQRRINTHQPERIIGFIDNIRLINEALRLILEIRIEACDKVHVCIDSPAVINIQTEHAAGSTG